MKCHGFREIKSFHQHELLGFSHPSLELQTLSNGPQMSEKRLLNWFRYIRIALKTPATDMYYSVWVCLSLQTIATVLKRKYESQLKNKGGKKQMNRGKPWMEISQRNALLKILSVTWSKKSPHRPSPRNTLTQAHPPQPPVINIGSHVG